MDFGHASFQYAKKLCKDIIHREIENKDINYKELIKNEARKAKSIGREYDIDRCPMCVYERVYMCVCVCVCSGLSFIHQQVFIFCIAHIYGSKGATLGPLGFCWQL